MTLNDLFETESEDEIQARHAKREYPGMSSRDLILSVCPSYYDSEEVRCDDCPARTTEPAAEGWHKRRGADVWICPCCA